MGVNSSQKWRVDDAEALARPAAGERGAKRCGINKEYQVKISDTFEALKKICLLAFAQSYHVPLKNIHLGFIQQ
jgi:hypothetical protein